MNMGDPKYGWYALIDAFEEKYPHVNIAIGPTDRGSDLQKLLSGVVGDSPPDVFRREAQLFGDIAARDILMPLDEFVEADKSHLDGLHEEDYPAGVWESGKYEGVLYGISESVNPLILAYNKDHFRQAGLDPEKPPETWDEWVETIRLLTLRDKQGRILRSGFTPHRFDILQFHILQQGAWVITEDGRTCIEGCPEAIRGAELTTAISNTMGGRGTIDKFWATIIGEEAEFSPFGMGKCSMSIEDDWVIFRVMRFHHGLNMGVAPAPHPPGHDPITVSMTHTFYFIPRNARHPKEAWDFIRFVCSPEGQLPYAAAMDEEAKKKGTSYSYTGIRSNRKLAKALDDAGYVPQEPLYRECFEEAKRILDHVVPLPPSPASALIQDELKRVVDDTAYGVASATASYAAARNRIQQQLDMFFGRESLPLFRWRYVWLVLLVLVLGAIGYLGWHTRGERAVSGLQRRENRSGLFFITPWAVGFLLFIAGPMVFSIAISFCDYDVLHPARFVGFRNYRSLVFQDPLFWKSLGNTAFMVVALPVGMSVSLGIALLLNNSVRGMNFYRTVFYLPAITPAIAAAVLWFALLNPDGLINDTLERWLGIHGPAWLADPNWSKPAMVLMGLWGAGGGMILWLAGLQGIPQQLYEAASIDGAGPFQRFFSVTLPMLTPYIFFSLVVGVIGVFQIFAQALVLTLGGPADSTLFYVYYLFNNAFRYFKMGYASAQAWILFVLVMILTAIQWRLSKRWVHYG